MANVFKLDTLRAEVDDEYKPFKIEVSDGTEVTLRSLIRLNEKDRTTVLELIDSINSKDDEEAEEKTGLEEIARLSEATSKIVEIAAGKDSEKLLHDLDGDLQLTLHVIKSWMEETQLGEAENSPDSSTSSASS